MPIPTAAAPDHVAVSACLLDAEGKVLAADGADRPYYAASTIKLHVLLAALQAADTGVLDLDERVPATDTFTGADGALFTLGGDHLDSTHPADGDPVSIRELLTRMIDRSSNEATDHLIELIGLDAVGEAITELGLTSTRVERMIGDASALAAGATNETSAADLARTMRALVRTSCPPSAPTSSAQASSAQASSAPTSSAQASSAQASSAQASSAPTSNAPTSNANTSGAPIPHGGLAPHSGPSTHSDLAPEAGLSARSVDLARTALRAQQIPVIARALREGVPWGSKSGWVDGYRHDVAFLGDPDAADVRYLAVMTSGLDPEAADEEIARRVRALVADVAA
ncbi:serine hydrolase [Brachybacterium fresconis]|uniref:Beta-lactamase class A n=1 Tax=Brachybacterium fresconis TaxID=173363 RepID=A0ABS4YMN4_9MICO|nr:serine hydrolase [Brachybacterium fresconis]MBP2410057.1 beta-lactamase class A [Brachybacterium fresconis]